MLLTSEQQLNVDRLPVLDSSHTSRRPDTMPVILNPMSSTQNHDFSFLSFFLSATKPHINARFNLALFSLLQI